MRNNTLLDALLPRTRQLILGAVLLQPERAWSLTDLAQHLALRPSSLQREMASLTASGILERNVNGNRISYQANPEFPLLPELQGLFIKTAGLADRVREALRPGWEHISFAFIYGSLARGERAGHSDVDLMIVGDVLMVDLVLSLRALERELQVPINTTQYALAAFTREALAGNHFLKTVLRGPKSFLKGSDDELADSVDGPESQDAHDEPPGT